MTPLPAKSGTTKKNGLDTKYVSMLTLIKRNVEIATFEELMKKLEQNKFMKFV